MFHQSEIEIMNETRHNKEEEEGKNAEERTGTDVL